MNLFGGALSQLQNPNSLAFDPAGRLIIPDDKATHGEVYAISPAGTLTTLFTVPVRIAGLVIDAAGKFYVSGFDGKVRLYGPNGNLLNGAYVSGLGGMHGLALGPGTAPWGNDLYLVSLSSGNLLRVDSTGSATIIGTGFTTPSGAVTFVLGIAWDSAGSMYISDHGNSRILRISRNMPMVVSIGSGCAGTAGQTPSLTASGMPYLSNQGLSADVSAGVPGGAAFLVLGVTAAPTPIPLGAGCFVYPLFPLITAGGPEVITGAGTASFPLPIPFQPTLVGGMVVIQTAILDPGSPIGLTLTNALTLTLN